jgi:hypothetical protein
MLVDGRTQPPFVTSFCILCAKNYGKWLLYSGTFVSLHSESDRRYVWFLIQLKCSLSASCDVFITSLLSQCRPSHLRRGETLAAPDATLNEFQIGN